MQEVSIASHVKANESPILVVCSTQNMNKFINKELMTAAKKKKNSQKNNSHMQIIYS